MLSVVTLSHPGAVRPTNEDAVLWDPQLGLLAVADGMGGHNAGEVASRMALDVLQQALRTSAVAAPGASTSPAPVGPDAPRGSGRDDAPWPFGFVDDVPLAANRLRTAIQLANRDIFRAAEEHPEYAGMGSTLTAALIEGAHVWFASIGDSRLYAKASESAPLVQMTRDDTFVGMLSDTTGVSAAALVDHPMRHLLTSVLGPRADITVDVESLILSDGQLLLMTTDGLHGDVGDAVIDAILDGWEQGVELQTAAEHLVDAALGAGGRDNITLALARYSAES
jgi:serine/threonine protein phosphatase PrpC